MIILNLGCGTKTASSPDCVNIDWSIYLRLKQYRLLRRLAPLFVRGVRLQRFQALGDNILAHDLAKGIPFDSGAVDAVYHSHMLEHLDRHVAPRFLSEIHRVLKPGGIQRIVVPDFERICRDYLAHLDTCRADSRAVVHHESYIAVAVEQCVRRESVGVSQQPPLRRAFENIVLGDARKRGETHQWMYDAVSLGHLCTQLGFTSPRIQQYDTSAIPNWNSYGLDLGDDGGEYKPGSLYLEVAS